MVQWEDLSVSALRDIAKHYNKEVKIVGVSKLKKLDLLKELQKHLNISGNKIIHKASKKEYNIEAPKAKEAPKKEAPKKEKPKKEAPKKEEPKKEEPKKASDKSYQQATESEILDKFEEYRQDLFFAVLDSYNINTSGKSDKYLDKVSDKYYPIADAYLVKWFRKGGEEYVKEKLKEFFIKYGS